MLNTKDDDYDTRLLDYITQYVYEQGVPPTIDMMIENVEGRSSKSTVYNRLQKMVRMGLLVQKNIKGYYYPTYVDDKEVTLPKYLLIEACEKLICNPDNEILVKKLSNYLY